MSASTSLSSVEKMLKECAPGYTIRLANHSRVIHFNGKLYRTFPKADPIENGHVRKLVRYLGINPSCASKHLPGVIKEDKDNESKGHQDVTERSGSIKPKPKPNVQDKSVKKL
jgi:hypothetical protein